MLVVLWALKKVVRRAVQRAHRKAVEKVVL
jgi:hypothetical protein